MHIGVFIEETWSFFHEIYADLEAHHQTEVFKRRSLNLPFFRERANRYLFRRDLLDFIQRQDVLFFEWASELLVQVSHLPKSKPVVARLHRYELYQYADQVNWQVVDRVILVAEAKRREFLSRFPYMADRVIVIPEAVSLQRFQSQIKPFNGDLGILCHLTPRKRVYEVILAFGELLARQPGFHLHIGGGAHELHGDYAAALRQLVDKLGLRDRVTFYGNVPEPENWYRKIDIILSNSYSEGLQVSPMEAIASGCYCLCHRWDGAEEFYPEETLFLQESELVNKLLAYSRQSQEEKEAKIRQLQAILRGRFNLDETKAAVRRVVEEAANKG
ncbi:MAG: glycosyltransferase family 4 protein [Chloroflexi bacterium]|nr:glycosyltransferase family 4 protein [Chloroflexota bacterium]